MEGKLYILKNKNYTPGWLGPFLRYIQEHFNAEEFDAESSMVPVLTEKDYLFVSYYKDIDYETPAKKILFTHDCHNEFSRVEFKWLDYCYSKKDILYFCNNKKVWDFVKKHWPECEIHNIHFPYKFSEEKTFMKIKNTVVIGGRVSDQKNTLFLVALALQYPGYTFKVCSPTEIPQYLKDKNLPNVKFKTCNHDEYIEELKSAEFFLTYSLSDSVNISMVEAYNYGCKLVFPDYSKLHYQFVNLDWISGGFDPFDLNDIFNCEFDINEEWFNPDSFCARMGVYLK